MIELVADLRRCPVQAGLPGRGSQLPGQRPHRIGPRQDRRQRPPARLSGQHRQHPGPDQRRLAAPGRTHHQQHRTLSPLRRRPQQPGELPDLLGATEEHPLLVALERPQPRERRTILRPGALDLAQRLDQRGTVSGRIPRQVTVLDRVQQRAGHTRFGVQGQQPDAPRPGDRDLSRAPLRRQGSRGDQGNHRVGPAQLRVEPPLPLLTEPDTVTQIVRQKHLVAGLNQPPVQFLS